MSRIATLSSGVQLASMDLLVPVGNTFHRCMIELLNGTVVRLCQLCEHCQGQRSFHAGKMIEIFLTEPPPNPDYPKLPLPLCSRIDLECIEYHDQSRRTTRERFCLSNELIAEMKVSFHVTEIESFFEDSFAWSGVDYHGELSEVSFSSK